MSRLYVFSRIMMKKIIFALAVLFCVSCSCYASEKFIEIQIPCRVNESVKVIMPNGEIVMPGKVLMTPSKTNWPAYTASKWSTPSSVCASAVNAIHILIDVENDRGRIISLVPSVTVAPAASRGSFFSLDMPAGTGIFGGFAPLTGSRVTLMHEGIEHELTDTPEENDTLIIRTELSSGNGVYMADIENRPAGRVIVYDSKGAKVIARVIRPVHGVGRFGGSVFQNRGRIRASHSGVIDVATSARDSIGGIQIMPLKHALTSTEMINAWALTQWMIIAPLPDMPDLEGHEPLFKRAFVPGAQLEDKLPDIWSHYGRRPLVLCRRDGGNWEMLPDVSGKVDDALNDVTHLRLYFPTWNEPLNPADM